MALQTPSAQSIPTTHVFERLLMPINRHPFACKYPSPTRTPPRHPSPINKRPSTTASASTNHPTPTTIASSSSPTPTTPQVVLTREAGKNGKLLKMLQKRGIHCLEMPLIETTEGPDTHRLPTILRQHSQDYDWVCITSPEAAKVFMKGWIEAGRSPSVRIAVVGDGTGKIFIEAGEAALLPQFTPSVANAEHFAPELPRIPGGTNRILYPSSNKASTQLQEGLLARGFVVDRLNTYDTLPVTTLDARELELAKEAAVVAVASPSAVKAWVHFVGKEVAGRVSVACIGSTSARAAEKAGLSRVFYPDAPGLDTFAATIEEALGSIDR